ncbi:hypothetical protein [Terrabacter sp. 2YAF2]|uniref:hypothetical protein n=1 Tax=Terrabacter sp. 2YAF2 TaxID=3233026 RepID=UPI003F9815AA
MSTTKSISRSATRRKAASAAARQQPLDEVLGTLTLTEARDAFFNLNQAFGILPERAAAELARDFDILTAKAVQIGLKDLKQLVANQDLLLAAVTHLAEVDGEDVTAVAERSHHWRNLALTLALAGVSCHHAKPTTICRHITSLPDRTAEQRRPLRADEALLLRTYIAVELHHAPITRGRTNAAIYALMDAGCNAGETSYTTLNHFDVTEVPTTVIAHGNKHIGDRVLHLDRFARIVLGQLTRDAVERDLDTAAPLTYRPRGHKDKSNSSNSTPMGIITRLMTAVGLRQRDLTPGSVTQWRVEQGLAAHGTEYALAISGRSSIKQMEEQLYHRPIQQEPTAAFRRPGLTLPAA